MPRALIVDDNPENRYLLSALFKGHGYTADEAHNGAEALELARATPPDLIVSDILMPAMDGFALCRLWKQDPQLSHIPFIFYTATYTDPSDRDFALGLGADHFMIKPAEPDDFMSQVESVLERFRSGKATARPGGALADAQYLARHNDALARKLDKKVSELAEASRVKDEFVSTMSHELRTPLNVILGYVEMLADPTIDVGSRREVESRAVSAGRDLLDLIDRTLVVSGIEAGRTVPQIERVPLRLEWEHLRLACGELARPDGVTLVWDEEVPDIAIETDRHKLEVVVRNLVDNACKFTERGHVRVSASCSGGELHVDVSDTGVGIAPEHRDEVFEMFRQVDATHTRRQGGVGLGLYIVRRFVSLLGGAVGLESTPGQGSHFRVTLPLAAAGDASRGNGSEAEPAPSA